MIYDKAKPEHVIGKTIRTIQITDDYVEINFTDGSQLHSKLEYVGYAGCSIDSTYYEPTSLPGEEEA